MNIKLPAVLIMALLLAFTIARGEIADMPDSTRCALCGSWRHFDITCDFASNGIMTINMERSGESMRRSFNYRLFRMGANGFCEYGDNSMDVMGQGLMYIGDITDTTAVIASGTPFLKTGETPGMFGTWKHVAMYRTISLTLDPDRIAYRESIFDPATKTEHITEQRSGTYLRMNGTANNDGTVLSGGRYLVHFADGSFATLFPVVYNDRMYLFDLSPCKSVFERVPPSDNPYSQSMNPS